MAQINRRCYKCKQEFHSTVEFFTRRKRNGRYGLKSECKTCHNKMAKLRYSKNKTRLLMLDKEKRDRLKAYFIANMGGKCSKCGGVYPNVCYDFHHVDMKTKEKSPGSLLSAAFETAKKEMDKCVLVCANCHRLIHAELRL